MRMPFTYLLTGIIVLGGSIISMQTLADEESCQIEGSYGYVYDGVSYDTGGAVEIAETGSFRTYDCSNESNEGELCGQAKATFHFSYSPITGGPLWMLLELNFDKGKIEVSETDNCAGTVKFEATGEVLESDPEGLEGIKLFVDQERSIAYTVSGDTENRQRVDIISTSPGSVLAGTAMKQKIR